MKDPNEVFDHSVFESIQCQKHDQEAHYHFTLTDILEYVKLYGVDKVMIDIYDMLAAEGNFKISLYETGLDK